MKRKLLAGTMSLLAVFLLSAGTPAQEKRANRAAAKEDAATCYQCHAPVKELHVGGKHGKLGCGSCHEGVERHLADTSQRPATRLDPATCGGCHKMQYQSFGTPNWNRPARFEKSQLSGPSPNPAWNRLAAPLAAQPIAGSCRYDSHPGPV